MPMTPDKRRFSLHRLAQLIEIGELPNWTHLHELTGVAINTLKQYHQLLLASRNSASELDAMSNTQQRKFVTTGTWQRHNAEELDVKGILRNQEKHNESLIDGILRYQTCATGRAFAESTCYRKLRQARKARQLTVINTHHPGESMQVDFAGETLVVSGSEKRGPKKNAPINFFVAILPFSQYTCVYATQGQDALSFIEAHEFAFQFFGGVPNTLVPDNAKAAVIKPGPEPILNPAYQELAMVYGVTINPARPYKPRDKALVENAVGIVNRWIIKILKRQKFMSIQEVKDALVPLVESYNARPFKKKPGSRKSVFLEHELPMLRSLPSPLPQLGVRCAQSQIKSDGHINFKGHCYSVPYKYRNCVGVVKANAVHMMIYVDGINVATHEISYELGGYTTVPEHKHPRQIAADGYSYEYALSLASDAGVSVTAIVEELFSSTSRTNQNAQRIASKILKLADKYGYTELESACHFQIRQGYTAYTHIKNCLMRKTYLSHVAKVHQQSNPNLPGGAR